MRFVHWILFLGAFSASFAAVPAKKTAPAKAVSGKTVPRKATAPTRTSVKTKAAVARRTGSKTATARSRGGARSLATASARSHQAVPTPERYKEIQEALASKGYLKSEANGVWDANSAEALKQFQTDHNLAPTGKLSSASLIGLGLGPKTSTEPVLPPVPHKDSSIPAVEPPPIAQP